MPTEMEKYLERRRLELDVENPDDQVIWEGIRKDLQSPDIPEMKKRNWQRIRNMAAVAAVILCVGYVLTDLITEGRSSVPATLASIDKDLGDRENEYKTMVALKLEEAGTKEAIDNMIIAELFEEIQRLDTIYEQTLKDLEELGYNEQVINTIFDTYEKKIYLLELIILENNKNKNHETEQYLFL